MLMGPPKRRIDKEVARQRAIRPLEVLPELAPDAARFPAATAVIDRIPVPKVLRQVAPRRSRAGEIENGFNAHPIAEHWGTASAGFDRREDRGNLRPGLVGQ